MVETIGAIKCNFELKAHTIKGNKGISMGHNKSALNFFQNSPFKWKSLWKNLNSCGLKSKTHPDFAAEISSKKSVLLSSNYGKSGSISLQLLNMVNKCECYEQEYLHLRVILQAVTVRTFRTRFLRGCRRRGDGNQKSSSSSWRTYNTTTRSIEINDIPPIYSTTSFSHLQK